ncbi:MAG TPA: hypothetical protein VMV51_00585 [Gemmatimonadaceae bacterium]|nr:hypothetical protein [Gemmatimonadaceae bacterium]
MTPLAMLLSAIRGGGRRGRAPTGEPEATVPTGRPGLRPSVVPAYVRRATIYAFSAQGLSRDEIVRRTGFAYDAVTMLMSNPVTSSTPEDPS